MPAPTLPSTLSLETLRNEILWSKLACESNKYAKEHAPKFDACLAKWSIVHNEQLAHWDAQTAAQFGIWRVDARIDVRIDHFNVALLTVVNQDRKDPHYTLYMTEAPSALKKPVLGSELETVRGWVAMLQDEDEPTLKAFAAKFDKDVTEADAALEEASRADAANSQFRAVGALAQFVAEVNKSRDEVYLALEKVRMAHDDLPKDFARQFFRGNERKETPEEIQAKRDARLKAREDAAKRKADMKAALAQMKALKKEIAGLKK